MGEFGFPKDIVTYIDGAPWSALASYSIDVSVISENSPAIHVAMRDMVTENEDGAFSGQLTNNETGQLVAFRQVALGNPS